MQPAALAVREARQGYVVHVKNHTGHRAGYQTLFAERLGLERSTGVIGPARFWNLLRAKYVLLGTIDGEYFAALTLGIVRALIGRPTTGLFLRPQTAFQAGAKFRAKRAVFSAIKRLRLFRLLTIVPFDMRPEYAQIADGWVHDPEMWDLALKDIDTLPQTDFAHRVREHAQGRPIVAFIGGASKVKGFQILCDMLGDEPDFAEKVLVVVAGRVSEPLRQSAARIAGNGAMVEDRFMSDDEILSLYGIADLIWCVYDASYDQASGVFGRAFQTSKPVIVRDGAMIAAQADFLGLPSHRVALDEDLPKISDLALKAKQEHSAQEPLVAMPQAAAYAERTLRLLAYPTSLNDEN